MTDEARRDLDLGEDESLPWLETADDYDEPDGPSAGKVIGLVLGGLVLIALVVGAIYAFQSSNPASEGNGELIAAQEGDYKVAPEDPQGKTFEGEGDAAFAASEGKSRESNAAPEPASKTGTSAKTADAPGGVFVQLAALGSESAAEQQWSTLTGRYDYLKDMRHRVVAAQVDGNTVYRLSALSSDRAAATALCDRIKSDGGSCLITG